jgi:hypothetical protein
LDKIVRLGQLGAFSFLFFDRPKENLPHRHPITLETERLLANLFLWHIKKF